MILTDFPDELLLPILKELSFHDIHQNVARVCKKLLRLSRVPAELRYLKLDIDEHGKANFNANLLSLHCETKVLDIDMDCCRTKKSDSPTFAHQVMMDGLAMFWNLTSLRIHGQCRNLKTTFDDIEPSKLAMIRTIDLGFPMASRVLSKFTNLRYVTLKLSDEKGSLMSNNFLRALSEISQMFAHTLERLHIEAHHALHYQYYPPGFWTTFKQHVTENCPRLEHIHLPLSKEYWDSVSELTTLKSIGITGTTLLHFKKSLRLAPIMSPKLEELTFYDIEIAELPLGQMWNSLPERQIKKIQFKLRHERTSTIQSYLSHLAIDFTNLEELVWEQDLKSSMFPSRTGYIQKTLALNPPRFRKLKKITMPYNSEVPLFKYCPNFNQLTLTWNQNVRTTDDLFSEMMTDLLTNYGLQIQLLTLEQNPQQGFRISDQFKSLLEFSCPNAVIKMHFK